MKHVIYYTLTAIGWILGTFFCLAAAAMIIAWLWFTKGAGILLLVGVIAIAAGATWIQCYYEKLKEELKK